jgi:hypothetical protein
MSATEARERARRQIEVPSWYSTGLDTTPAMWRLVSEQLDGLRLPSSINEAIYALCNGQAFLVHRDDPPPR